MYNAKIKCMFLETQEERREVWKAYLMSRFNKVEPFEKQFKKDAACFNKEEIFAFYKSLHSKSAESLVVVHWFMRLYAWYYKDNVDDTIENNYLSISKNDLKECLDDSYSDSIYISREGIMTAIGNMVNPNEMFVVLALYEGIGAVGVKFEELVDLRMSDFDRNFVHLKTGRILHVSDELIRLAKLSSDTYEFVFETESRPVYFDKSDDRILKRRDNFRSDNESAAARRILNITVRVREQTGIEAFKSKVLLNSGMVDMVKALMAKHNISDPSRCIKENKNDIEHRYGKIYSISKFVEKYRHILME